MTELSLTQITANTIRDKAYNTKPGERFEVIRFPKNIKGKTGEETINARVEQRRNDGTLTLKTDHGTIIAKAEKSSSIKKGDNVTMRIEQDNKTATIQTLPHHTQSTKTQEKQEKQAQSSNTQPPQNRPEPISTQHLITLPPIAVTPFSSQNIATITLPHLTTIETTATQHSNRTHITNFLTENTLLDTPNLALLTQIPSAALQTEPTFTPEKLTDQNNLSAHVALKYIKNNHIISESYPPQSDHITIYTAQQHNITITPTIETITVNDAKPPKPIIEHGQNFKPHGITDEQTHKTSNTTLAKFVGFTPDKHFPILKIHTPTSSEDRYYTLQQPVSDLILGSTLSINTTDKITQPSPLPITATALPLTAFPAHIALGTWPTLTDIQETLMQKSPQAMQSFTASLPNSAAPNNIGGTVLFFLAAMRSGDIQNWLGDKVIETLRNAGKGDTLTRLGAELSSIARLANDPTPQDWRMLSLPFIHHNDIHKIVMHYRKENHQNDEEAQGAGSQTRFVMDLNLSNIGKVQLDALFIAQTQGTGRLDLVLRTENSFSSAMKQQMRENYTNALHTTHITGELIFQNNPDQWVAITPNKVTEFTQDI